MTNYVNPKSLITIHYHTHTHVVCVHIEIYEYENWYYENTQQTILVDILQTDE